MIYFLLNDAHCIPSQKCASLIKKKSLQSCSVGAVIVWRKSRGGMKLLLCTGFVSQESTHVVRHNQQFALWPKGSSPPGSEVSRRGRQTDIGTYRLYQLRGRFSEIKQQQLLNKFLTKCIHYISIYQIHHRNTVKNC